MRWTRLVSPSFSLQLLSSTPPIDHKHSAGSRVVSNDFHFAPCSKRMIPSLRWSPAGRCTVPFPIHAVSCHRTQSSLLCVSWRSPFYQRSVNSSSCNDDWGIIVSHELSHPRLLLQREVFGLLGDSRSEGALLKLPLFLLWPQLSSFLFTPLLHLHAWLV